MEMPRSIDLDEYRTSGVRVFSGRERGRLIRAKAGLDDLDHQPNPVIVRIPEDVVAVSSGFFLALFGDSIRRFGREGLRAHYRFEGADISAVVEDALEQATTSVSGRSRPI